MPYEIRGKCIYRKDTGKKIGCTKGDVKKYLKALHANVKEAKMKREYIKEKLNRLIERIVREEMRLFEKKKTDSIKSPGNKSSKNVFGDDTLNDLNSNPKPSFKEYPISYDEACKKIKGIKDKAKLDRVYEELFAQMDNSLDRRLFRTYYQTLRNDLSQKV